MKTVNRFFATLQERRETQAGLCWLCGQSTNRIACNGETIGSMVYTAHILVSLEIGENLGKPIPLPQHLTDHVTKDCLQVCTKCIADLGSQVGHLPTEYVSAHLYRSEEQLTDIADIDTGLKSWKDAIYPFGCWLRGFPDIDVRQKFYSMDLGELFERGFRFDGKVSFGEEEFARFLSRFASGTSEASNEFLEHVSDHIKVSEESQRRELAKVRAVVYDVSVWLACGNKRDRA